MFRLGQNIEGFLGTEMRGTVDTLAPPTFLLPHPYSLAFSAQRALPLSELLKLAIITLYFSHF